MSKNQDEKSSNKNGVVFVVEDDFFLAKAYRIRLEEEGFEIWLASSGTDALSFLAKDPPNVVLLDLILPGASGFEVLAAIRENKQWKDVPVIIMSNLGQPEDIEKVEKYGVEDYIIKADVKLKDVVDRVRKYM